MPKMARKFVFKWHPCQAKRGSIQLLQGIHKRWNQEAYASAFHPWHKNCHASGLHEKLSLRQSAIEDLDAEKSQLQAQVSTPPGWGPNGTFGLKVAPIRRRILRSS